MRNQFTHYGIVNMTKKTKVDLLFISEGENQHYCLIKNLSKLVSSQVNNHEHKIYICRLCLNPFNSEVLLNKHKEYCSSNKAVKVVIAEEGSTLKFKNFLSK